MLIPFATRPAQPMYCRFTPGRGARPASPGRSRPAPRSPVRLAAAPAAAASSRPGRREPARPALIAANVSHEARFSSRCVRSGDRSPACSAIVHPFRLGSSLTSAATYFPACSHVCVRAKHDRSRPSRSARSRTPARPLSWQQQPPSIHCCLHTTHDRQAAAPCQTEVIRPARLAGQTPNGGCRTRHRPGERRAASRAGRRDRRS